MAKEEQYALELEKAWNTSLTLDTTFDKSLQEIISLFRIYRDLERDEISESRADQLDKEYAALKKAFDTGETDDTGIAKLKSLRDSIIQNIAVNQIRKEEHDLEEKVIALAKAINQPAIAQATDDAQREQMRSQLIELKREIEKKQIERMENFKKDTARSGLEALIFKIFKLAKETNNKYIAIPEVNLDDPSNKNFEKLETFFKEVLQDRLEQKPIKLKSVKEFKEQCGELYSKLELLMKKKEEWETSPRTPHHYREVFSDEDIDSLRSFAPEPFVKKMITLQETLSTFYHHQAHLFIKELGSELRRYEKLFEKFKESSDSKSKAALDSQRKYIATAIEHINSYDAASIFKEKFDEMMSEINKKQDEAADILKKNDALKQTIAGEIAKLNEKVETYLAGKKIFSEEKTELIDRFRKSNSQYKAADIVFLKEKLKSQKIKGDEIIIDHHEISKKVAQSSLSKYEKESLLEEISSHFKKVKSDQHDKSLWKEKEKLNMMAACLESRNDLLAYFKNRVETSPVQFFRVRSARKKIIDQTVGILLDFAQEPTKEKLKKLIEISKSVFTNPEYKARGHNKHFPCLKGYEYENSMRFAFLRMAERGGFLNKIAKSISADDINRYIEACQRKHLTTALTAMATTPLTQAPPPSPRQSKS